MLIYYSPELIGLCLKYYFCIVISVSVFRTKCHLLKIFQVMFAKERRQGIFVIGLIAGLVGGALFAFYLLSNQPYDNTNEKNLLQRINPFGSKKETTEAKKESPAKRTFAPSKVNIDEQDETQVYELDSTDLELMGYEEVVESEMPVKRDEMVYSLNITIEGDKDNASTNLDSLLQDDKYHRQQPGIVRVEFWKSPINFSGYKYSGQKLVLFGIFDYKSVKLLRIKSALYMQYNDQYYLMESRNEFSRFVAVKKP